LSKTLIVYASKHGCTEKCATLLKSNLSGEVDLHSIKDKVSTEIYDTVVIGGSIHAGRIQKSVKDFCVRHHDLLIARRLGLFICCMEEGEKAQKQFDDAYPESLRQHAKATGLFGGAFDFDRMNFIEKKIIKKVAGVTGSISKISETEIQAFAKRMQA